MLAVFDLFVLLLTFYLWFWLLKFVFICFGVFLVGLLLIGCWFGLFLFVGDFDSFGLVFCVVGSGVCCFGLFVWFDLNFTFCYCCDGML